MKKHKLLDTYLFTEDDLRLTRTSHTFAASSVWQAKGMDKWTATFDLFVRDFTNRNYMLFCGLEEILHYLQNFHFTKSDIRYLLQYKVITKEGAKYLKKFRFTGDVYAMPEGTPFFPGEPIVRITAPLVEAALTEMPLINIIASNIPFLTKAMRIIIAAQGKIHISTGPLRGHSFESGMKASRAGYIAGMTLPSVPSVNRKYDIPCPKPLINGQHLFIKSFSNELDAMEALTEYFPDNSSFMVDTYDTAQGIANAITVAKKLEAKGHKLSSIYIDSGDLVEWCHYAREEFSKNNLDYIQISAASNLDEYKVKDLVDQKIDCDYLAVLTEFLTLSDAPKLEAVYKLAEIQKEEEVIYKAKLATGKLSLPGRKQVFRSYTAGGIMSGDAIGFENENLGQPLLQKVMEKGKIIYNLPSLEEIREYTHEQVKKMPPQLLDLTESHSYKVEISPNINAILDEIRKKHVKNS